MEKVVNFFKIKNNYFKGLFTFLIIFLLSALTMVITLTFASPIWNLEMPIFNSYFNSFLLLTMNFLPIFLFMVIFYLLSNRLWISFAIPSFLFTILAIVNKFKLTYRDDPFTFTDIKLIKESLEMKQSYSITLNRNMFILFAGLFIITILLKVLFDYRIDSKKTRLSLLIFSGLATIIIFSKTYYNSATYNKIGDKKLINIWSDSQQFQSKGFIYPFIYSIKDAKDTKPKGYNQKNAIKEISQFDYLDIPEDKKVNIIAIMLESYNDFSKFEGVNLGIDIYENFHQLEKESYHGNLITNIFGGDTIKTERSFITGYHDHPKYTHSTNSFAWYFKEQGYRTKAMHPIYGWFYNRRNVNPYLGFDSYDYYENKYEAIQKNFFMDMEFFDFIIDDYKASISDGIPYFNFSVTYQNHGPYSDEESPETEFLVKDPSYHLGTYNIINNYFSGISQTDKAIKKLIDFYREEEEPTVVILFGDHNPALGLDGAGYDMMGINIDLGTVDGFVNYYETPYIVWGNDAAKQTLDRDFSSNGEDISPNFLMAEVFEYLGWKGNEYLQYVNKFKENVTALNKLNFKEDGVYTNILSLDNQELYKNYLDVEYYYSHNFKSKLKADQ